MIAERNVTYDANVIYADVPQTNRSDAGTRSERARTGQLMTNDVI